MNRKEMTHILESYWYCTKRLDSLYDEYHIYKSKATRETTRLSKAPGGGGYSDSRYSAADKAMEIERDYRKEKKKLEERRRYVSTLIDSLPDYRWRLVMQDRFLHFMEWRAICDTRHYSWRGIFKIRDQAIDYLIANWKDTKSA